VSALIHYVSNVTAPIGRDAIFTCVVDSVDHFKVIFVSVLFGLKTKLQKRREKYKKK